MTRLWFDTEFMEDGRTVDLLSIGVVRADGEEYYAELAGADYDKANPWVAENVLPHLIGGTAQRSRLQIADDVTAFAGDRPEFWAYYADYDWVVLCQLYGTMMDLPQGWPLFCLDVKQWAVMVGNPRLPELDGKAEHHALWDARETHMRWEFLRNRDTA